MQKTRFIWNQIYCYKQIEEKLERYAEKGLFFTKVGLFAYKFERREPKKVKYCLTFFEEASAFSNIPTENQESLIALAEASGWQYLSQNGRMQFFVNEEENPVPFETDPAEKLRNIKKCVGRSFVLQRIGFIALFLLQLYTQLLSLESSPSNFYSSPLFFISLLTFFVFILGNLFYLGDYYHWCKASENAVAAGGDCVETPRRWTSVFDMLTLGAAFGILIYALVLFIASPPTLLFEKTSNWPYSMSSMSEPSHQRKLQQDPLPLTLEMLYSTTGGDVYSYEADETKSFLLERNHYTQTLYTTTGGYPDLSYTIYKPKVAFVKNAVAEELRQEDKWNISTRVPLENNLFGTTEAYLDTYTNDPVVMYTLFYENKMATLTLPKAVTPEEVSLMREALDLY